ncbi:hypothetical protein ACT453_40560, partial [Bacillus sp. D-CC]
YEVYSLKAKDLIQNATMSKDMKVTIDASEIKNKVAEINKAKSTLHKDFAFKTHSGSVISVKGQGYGCMNVKKIVNGTKSAHPASHHLFGNLRISHRRTVTTINIV